MPLAFTRRVYLCSIFLISPASREDARLAPASGRLKIRPGRRPRPPRLCLLSSSRPASRRRRRNVTAQLSSERHLFVVAYCFFEGGLTRPTFILDRQRRDPTKGRIRNTPRSAERKSAGPRAKCQETCAEV